MRRNTMTTPTTLSEMLRERAVSARAGGFIWITDDEGGERKLSYASLDTRARAVAAWLQANVRRGDRVALLFDPGIEFLAGFFGCLYAGAIAVPAYGSRGRRDRTRIEAILQDSQPAAALTGGLRAAQTIDFAASHDLRAVPVETITDDAADAWRDTNTQAEELAYLQYTSGSTTTPRGVMITHRNVLANLEYIASDGDLSTDAFTVSWLPHFHDMGLVYGLLLPLYVGCPAALFSYASFVQRPARWLEAVTRYGATHSGGPNAAYELCANRITPEDRARLDLASWRVAFNGAEPLRAATLERFAHAFAPAGFRSSAFYPVYGLAEATLKVTSPRAGEGYRMVRVGRDEWLQGNVSQGRAGAGEIPLVGCGRAGGEHEVRIVNPETFEPCAPGRVGEIWVRGASVAAGYWNKPEDTNAVFGARLAGADEVYLRTGDLGFMDGGELFIAGRLKDCIIIRGQNHYPQDFEETARGAHPALAAATVAAFAVETAEGESFAVVLEAPRGVEANTLVEPVQSAIGAEHQLQPARVVVVAPNAIPRTSSGKLRRAACRQQLEAGTLAILAESRAEASAEASVEESADLAFAVEIESAFAEMSEVETQIAVCAARVLECERASITAGRDLGELGLDSLRAAELANALHASFGVTLGMLDVLECASVRRLATLVASGAKVGAGLAALPVQREFPLAGGQAGLWFLSRLMPESSAYQIARAVRIEGAADTDALGASFVEIVRRHPALRTSFQETGAGVVQLVEDAPASVVEIVDAAAWDETELSARLERDAREPFDLASAPLLRVRLYTQGTAASVLLFVVHHLVCDLWSLDLLLEELSRIYADGGSARNLPAPSHAFADFVRAEEKALLSAEESWSYWEETLAGELPVLQLSEKGSAAASLRPAAHVRFTVPAQTTRKLKSLAAAHDGTLHTLLLTIFQVLLRRYTQQPEFIVGTPTLGRHWPEFAGVVGCFVNTLPIRTRFARESTFLEIHEGVRRAVRDAVRHSVVPFPSIVERLSIARERGTTPVYQAMFTFQRQRAGVGEGVSLLALATEGGSIRVGALEARTQPVIQGMAQFDVTLTMAEAAGELRGTLEYDAQLFDEAFMSNFVAHFNALVEQIATHGGDTRIDAYEILSTDERRLQLETWNDTRRDYGLDLPLHTLIEEQAAHTPARIALRFAEEEVTYSELNERAGALASVLREAGVGRGDIVAVCAGRSCELVYALLAILKAGAAYLPLDTDGPAGRWRDMLSQAGVRVAVATEQTKESLAETGVRVVLTSASHAFTQTSTDEVARTTGAGCSPDDLAYVIFTSGSTGRPKGVAVPHRGIVNRLRWMQERYALDASDVILQKTPYTFDVSVWEFFWPLMYGATLAVAEPGGHRDPAYIADAIRRHRVTTLHFVPSMLRVFLDAPAAPLCSSLRRVICSGEALTPDLESAFRATLACELHNLYGPTEASVDATAWECDGANDSSAYSSNASPVASSVPIGRPIANMRAYILDAEDQPLPVTRAGALHLSGVGLARGYVNNPALTAELFVPDPHSTEPGARMYRTGDVARYRADGVIEFLGRRDQQVKLRGFRIELAEVAHALSAHASVKECVVDLQGTTEEPELVAFFVPLDATADADTSVLRAHLKALLPDYMIPVAFVALEEMPVNANGKLDRKALPRIERERFCTNEYVAPRTEAERKLAHIWSELLEVPRIGVDDNFFELGGHSLLASRMMNRVREEFRIDIPLLAFFESEPTVAEVAATIEAELARGDASALDLELTGAFDA